MCVFPAFLPCFYSVRTTTPTMTTTTMARRPPKKNSRVTSRGPSQQKTTEMLPPSTGELKAGLENLAPQLLAEFRHNGERDEVASQQVLAAGGPARKYFPRNDWRVSGRNPGLERARQTNPVQMIGRPGKLCTAPQRQSHVGQRNGIYRI